MHKVLSLLTVISIIICFFAGCTTTNTVNKQYVSLTQALRVTSVSDMTVTGIKGELSSPEQADEITTSAVTEWTPPEIPSGDVQATPPEMPTGDAQGITPPDMPMGGFDMVREFFTSSDVEMTFELSADTVYINESSSAQFVNKDSITENSIIEVKFSSTGTALAVIIKDITYTESTVKNTVTNENVENGSSAETVSQNTTLQNETYSSEGDDENALRIDGSSVVLEGITVNKTGGESSSTENGDFYGANAGLLALNSANVTIRNATVNTSAQNGNGVFSYGNTTVVNIYDTVIRTQDNNSGGIQTTGGATTNAYDLDVQTEGNSSAAIRSDRGGGDVNVSGGMYVTNGTGSPAIYSTADISAENATLIANNSEAVVVEGKNSVALTDCTVTGNMSGTYAEKNSEVIHNVMLYQSMSGDAAVGQSNFSMKNGSLTSKSGDMFYVTNTSCIISLENVTLDCATDTLLRVAGNDSSRGWGKEGENGGKCTFKAISQKIKGDIVVDDISSLEMSLESATQFSGSINAQNSKGNISLSVSDNSVLSLTADSFVTSFSGDISNIISNGFTLYVNGTAVN